MIDAGLEQALDEVGRDKVFASARALGWGAFDPPPKFVWWGIIALLRDNHHPSQQIGAQPQNTDASPASVITK